MNTRIVRLEANNVLRLKAVEIHPDPDGNLVVLGGRNAQGKTSTLDAIEMALGGARKIPPRPVHGNEQTGYVILETEDLVVRRTFNAEKSTSSLTVRSKTDGGKHGQAILDRLVNPRSFDPLAFDSLKPAEQTEELRQMVGLDFTELDAERAQLYDQRTEINREMRRYRDVAESIIGLEAAPEAPVDVAALTDELERRQAHNRGIEKAWNQAESALANKNNANQRATGIADEIEELRDRISNLEAHLDEANALINQYADEEREAEEAAEAMEGADEEEIREQLRSAEERNALYRERVRCQEAEKQAESRKNEAEAKTSRIDEIDAEKARGLAQAPFPVPELSFGPDGVLLNGLPFEQASLAERIEVSTAMAFATHPELKIALIRDGSLLDDDSLALVARIAEREGGQVWIEMARGAPEGAVIIEDGMVLEKRQDD
jgi:DNA repair exonuclease SbcCD ATPase subunit